MKTSKAPKTPSSRIWRRSCAQRRLGGETARCVCLSVLQILSSGIILHVIHPKKKINNNMPPPTNPSSTVESFVFDRNCPMRSVWLVGCWVQTTLPTCLTKTIFQTLNSTRYDKNNNISADTTVITKISMSEHFEQCWLCLIDIYVGCGPKLISFHLAIK